MLFSNKRLTFFNMHDKVTWPIDVSSWSFWFSWLSNLVYFWLDDVVNATMRHSVAFKCANDAKKIKWSECIFPHGENRPEVRKQWIYTMDGFHVEIYSRILFLCIIRTFEGNRITHQHSQRRLVRNKQDSRAKKTKMTMNWRHWATWLCHALFNYSLSAVHSYYLYHKHFTYYYYYYYYYYY